MNAALIFQQVPKVMVEINAIAKNRKNQSQGYNFRGIDDVYNELHPLLSKHKIFSTTNIVEQKREEKPSKNGGVLTSSILTIKFTFYAEDGSSVDVTTIGEGMDSGDKASNKAMAVAHKYALMQLFSIPTDDAKDPENDSPQVQRVAQMKVVEQVQQTFPNAQVKEEISIGDYMPTFGKYKGQALSNFEVKELEGYVDYIVSAAKKDRKPIRGQVEEFINAVRAYAQSEQGNYQV
jgi:hypothetical protein